MIHKSTEPAAPRPTAALVFDLEHLRKDAVLYRTVDADPERRRRVEHYLGGESGPPRAAPRGSDASILRAILSSRVERFHLQEPVDQAIRDTSIDPVVARETTPVRRFREHLTRALARHRSGRDHEGTQEIALAIAAVHAEPPFLIDAAEELIESGYMVGARSIIESAEWPWSSHAATVIEWRFALATGDLAHARALMIDLESEHWVDAHTLERYRAETSSTRTSDPRPQGALAARLRRARN
jgi:hypothetical protein